MIYGGDTVGKNYKASEFEGKRNAALDEFIKAAKACAKECMCDLKFKQNSQVLVAEFTAEHYMSIEHLAPLIEKAKFAFIDHHRRNKRLRLTVAMEKKAWCVL